MNQEQRIGKHVNMFGQWICHDCAWTRDFNDHNHTEGYVKRCVLGHANGYHNHDVYKLVTDREFGIPEHLAN